MFVLKAITIIGAVLGCLSGQRISKDEHRCECDTVKEELASLKERLQKLEKQNQGHLQNEQGASSAQLPETSEDNAEIKDVPKRFVVEMDVEQEIIALKQAVGSLQHGTGSTYVRWGRSTCPSSAEIVYKGYTGGNHYTNTGGPGNHVCLPENPTWAKYLDGVQEHASTIYGAEYEDNYGGAFNPFNEHIGDEDVPCVVCKTNNSANLMIPARTNCYNGWTMEYTGYLMSSAALYHASSEYICVDRQPEFIVHGHANDEGTLLYLVQGVCGSLPCGPYVNGRELACVVCTK